MPTERVVQFNAGEETGRFFDESSLSHEDQPRIVILMGGVATGKTTIRRRHYSSGYVLVDASEIFLNLSRGEFFEFPGPFAQLLDILGPLIARRAISERRHIVTEIIGMEEKPLRLMMDALVKAGYHIDLQFLTCDVDESVRRNENRTDDSISAFYSEPYHLRWLTEAISDEPDA